jgi:UDP-N-acetylglucosamine 2-epimerase (non-hydrolysing)
MKEFLFSVVVGTRPGIIKMSPIIRKLQEQDLPHFVIHTGQHYSAEMDDVFMRELGVTSDVFRVSDSHKKTLHGEKTAHMLTGVEEVLHRERPGVVLVCGDANTNLAAGLAARKLHIILGHVESGLRSWDWQMPEEHNRVILDHISDLLFAPTEECVANLKRESVRGEIHLTGNTIVDALLEGIKIAKQKSRILEELAVEKEKYILLTSHREENVDNPKRLRGILEGMKLVLAELNMPIVFPIHPRTEKRVRELGFSNYLDDASMMGLQVIKPVGYLDFLVLLQAAYVVLTDSGGIQEEACILNKSTITLRNNTERPETIKAGTNVLAGTVPSTILEKAEYMVSKGKISCDNPFGDGKAAKRIVKICINALHQGVKLKTI